MTNPILGQPHPTPPPGYNEWDMLAHGTSSGAAQRAALFTWIVAGVELVLFGGCSAAIAIISTVPLEELRKMGDPAQIDQIAQIYPMLGAIAVVMFIFGFLPAIAYLILGFGVRAGKPLSITVTLVLAMTQCTVFGVLFINNTLASVQRGDPATLMLNVVTLGSLVGLLGYTARLLWQMKQQANNNRAIHTDPWNEP